MGRIRRNCYGVPVWSGEWERMPKINCRFYDKEKKDCVALRCIYCAYGHKECNFFKEAEQGEHQ